MKKLLVTILATSMMVGTTSVFAQETQVEINHNTANMQVSELEVLAELSPVNEYARSTTYEVTGNSVRLRKAPSLSAGIIGYLNKGDWVNAGSDSSDRVTADGYTWLHYYSYTHGCAGWVAVQYITPI